VTETTTSAEFTPEELGLALRNHGMHQEAVRYPITPIGMHYLLIHFDVPYLDEEAYELHVGGRVERPLRLTLDDIRARPAVTEPVMMECAGTGRAHTSPRAVLWPWRDEAVGCAEWTGTPLRPVLEEAGLLEDAVELLFTGHDRGIDQDVEQNFERSLSLEEALRDDVLLAYEINGQSLPPQHGFPLRVIVPDWYGMTSVKWLKSITAISEPFQGMQQAVLYRYKRSEDDPGTPVTRKNPMSLIVPPGFPDAVSRDRHLPAGSTLIAGRAWSGWGPVVRVEFSADGGTSWEAAAMEPPPGRHAWSAWSARWDASPGRHELCCRATDRAGNVQPLDVGETWNHGGYGINVVQRLPVVVA